MRKNKISCQSVKNNNCIPQNVDFARILAYQQNRAKITIHQEFQSYLSKRDEHFKNCTKSAIDNLLSSFHLYKSL